MVSRVNKSFGKRKERGEISKFGRIASYNRKEQMLLGRGTIGTSQPVKKKGISPRSRREGKGE